MLTWPMADGWWLLNSSSLFSSNVFGKMKVNRERDRRDSEFGWGWSGYAREGRWASHYTYVKSFFFSENVKFCFHFLFSPVNIFLWYWNQQGTLLHLVLVGDAMCSTVNFFYFNIFFISKYLIRKIFLSLYLILFIY